VRRAELTDQADVALRRITRDIRLALPNSLRVTTTGHNNLHRVHHDQCRRTLPRYEAMDRPAAIF
jgi:hypothetical protein